MCSALGLQHRPAGASTEEGHKNYQRAGAPLLRTEEERVGVVQPREEKFLGILYSSL